MQTFGRICFVIAAVALVVILSDHLLRGEWQRAGDFVLGLFTMGFLRDTLKSWQS